MFREEGVRCRKGTVALTASNGTASVTCLHVCQLHYCCHFFCCLTVSAVQQGYNSTHYFKQHCLSQLAYMSFSLLDCFSVCNRVTTATHYFKRHCLNQLAYMSFSPMQVGLAVDDIKGIQDAAVLQRLALQVCCDTWRELQ